MQKYASVDVYGSCRPFTCDRSKNCYRYLGRRCKFFLAFENSICPDYVTEKFYKALRYGLVPVIRGGSNNSQLFPQGSYIDNKNIKTVAVLVEYLKHLDRSTEEYLEYFDWRVDYDIDADLDLKTRAQCLLCTKLHQFNYTPDRKTYSNILSWHCTNYTEKGICDAPQIPLR